MFIPTTFFDPNLQVTSYLGIEDDVVVNMVVAELENEVEPDPRRIQISLEGFLNKNAAKFTLELWKLLLSAQENYVSGYKGIPTDLIQGKLDQLVRIEQVIDGILFFIDPNSYTMEISGQNPSSTIYSRVSTTSLRSCYAAGHSPGVFAYAKGAHRPA
jgi:hypothetical protein